MNYCSVLLTLKIKMNKRFTFVLIIIEAIFGLLPILAETSLKMPTLNFIPLDENYELSNMAVMDITQDKNGFIWIGTLKGLNRYDGNSIMQYYESEKGIPSNSINSLSPSKRGLWIGTSEGACHYDLENEIFSPISLGYQCAVTCIRPINDIKTGFATDKGFYFVDEETKKIECIDTTKVLRFIVDKYGQIWGFNESCVKSYFPDGKEKMIIFNKKDNRDFTPSSIYSSKDGTVWLGTTKDGLYKYDKVTNSFVHNPVYTYSNEEVKYIRSIAEDLMGNIWIGTENGLFIYNVNTGSCSHYIRQKGDGSINDNALYSIFLSREGIMWIGTFFGGVSFAILSDVYFNEILDANGNKFLDGVAVSSIFQDSQKRIWFTSENEGVYVFDTKTKQVRRINDKTTPGIKGNNSHTVAEDPYGNIWIGNFLDGLYRFSPNLEQKPDIFLCNKNDNSIPDNSIYCLLADNKDSLFIGLSSGVATYNYKTNRFKTFMPNYLSGVRVDDMLRSESNEIWMAAHFDGIFRYNPITGKFQHYTSNNCTGIKSDLIFCCFEDSKGNIWFGTNNGGIIKFDKYDYTFKSFGYSQELVQRDIYFIEEDSFGNLWLSTDRGIYSFSPENERFNYYKIENITVYNQFNYNSGYKDSIDGSIYLGSINGVCRFQPENIVMNKSLKYPKLMLMDFKIHGREILPGEDSPLKESIDKTQKIKLKYNENTISIKLMYIDYGTFMPNTFRYEYKLDAEEHEWNIASNPSICSYSNLAPGKYIFQVRLRNIEGKVIETRHLEIIVRPHLLLSPFFVTIYILLSLILVFYLFRIYQNRINDRMSLRIKQIEKENLETVNRHRMNFFTYISHEFRSPLTILMAILEDIKQDGQIKVINKEDAEIISHNTRRMHFLINQLMEFRSIETKHETISHTRGDIVAFCSEIFHLFIPLFKQNNLLYRFDTSCDNFITIFDSDKLEKIISNLLSNAVKFSIPFENQSSVLFQINIEEQSNIIVFSCFNKGSYISSEQKDVILQPFFKTVNAKSYIYNGGIGLALVKELVEMQNGTISIESDIENGTNFIVTLPIISEEEGVKNLDSINVNNTKDIIDNTLYDMRNLVPICNEESNQENIGKYSILVIDSDADLSHILKAKLKGSCNVKRVRNSLEALDGIVNNKTDLIICDTFMPGINGYDLCMKVKNNPQTRHIPIILIVLENTEESKLKGFQVGADGILVKPFSIQELILRINNILKSKKTIREYYESIDVKGESCGISNRGEAFVSEITRIIKENVSEQNLNVDFLAYNMKISRTKLYMNLKNLTGLSTTEFINKVKIDLAKEIMESNEITIKELSWRLGYNSTNYFSKMFKKYTGKNPSDYK